MLKTMLKAINQIEVCYFYVQPIRPASCVKVRISYDKVSFTGHRQEVLDFVNFLFCFVFPAKITFFKLVRHGIHS